MTELDAKPKNKHNTISSMHAHLMLCIIIQCRIFKDVSLLFDTHVQSQRGLQERECLRGCTKKWMPPDPSNLSLRSGDYVMLSANPAGARRPYHDLWPGTIDLGRLTIVYGWLWTRLCYHIESFFMMFSQCACILVHFLIWFWSLRELLGGAWERLRDQLGHLRGILEAPRCTAREQMIIHGVLWSWDFWNYWQLFGFMKVFVCFLSVPMGTC